ncbi:ribbon-helix-helix protein, CopG family [Niveispirillum sp.]|uniref:ribbon-helix-helix protein, CopG family n=1 Tax=Niveispirillum sp. TaxID=1917217 RepID=UPI001B576EBB|nr:ribbon-helix-helix protein, CopG family [Niveispirillum sp.]MBP7339090.1 ribbon-helix-helix protein, CopG family [Niveispirillum sp.]
MVKQTALSFRVSADLKEALERAAKDDDRSVSSLVERILKSWLTEKGYLPPPEQS